MTLPPSVRGKSWWMDDGKMGGSTLMRWLLKLYQKFIHTVASLTTLIQLQTLLKCWDVNMLLGYSSNVWTAPYSHSCPETEVSAHGRSADELVFTTWVIIQLKAGDYAATQPHSTYCPLSTHNHNPTTQYIFISIICSVLSGWYHLRLCDLCLCLAACYSVPFSNSSKYLRYWPALKIRRKVSSQKFAGVGNISL